MINLPSLIDDARCFETIRVMRWPDGLKCPECRSTEVIKDGRDDTQPQRQRYRCHGRGKRFDDLGGTTLAGHHRPLRARVLCLYFVGLNLSNEPTAREPGIDPDDARVMASQLRQVIAEGKPEVVPGGEVECDEVYVVAGHEGRPEAVRRRGRAARRRRLKGASGRGMLAQEEPPIPGMIQRGGPVVIGMLANVKRVTIAPLIKKTIAPGTLVYTDEYDIYARLEEWGYAHETVCHAEGEYARDDDGDGLREVRVNMMEGFWSLLRGWLRPDRGISQERLRWSLGSFEFVRDVRRRGEAPLGSLTELLVTTRNPG